MYFENVLIFQNMLMLKQDKIYGFEFQTDKLIKKKIDFE